jgi:dihydroxyacetone kinase-like protein
MLTQTDFRHFFFHLFHLYHQDVDQLNALDSAVGDGDHGDTLVRGFRSAARAAEEPHENLGRLFEAAANTLAEETGGAIGPLLATFFAEGVAVFNHRSEAGLGDIEQFFAAGFEALIEVGGAQPGDKTLLDALHPAVESLHATHQKTLADALDQAAAAAERGAEETANIRAVRGRARFLGERSEGHRDPGAVSFAMLVRALADIAAGLEVKPPEFGRGQLQSLAPKTGKFLNDPEDMILEDNLGLVRAYPALVSRTDSGVLVRSHPKEAGKVGLAIGHGGGHTPSMGGFVGPGLLDADVYGPLFTCASGLKIARAIALADRGAGVALLVSNHAGDVLNARMAVRKAEQEGREVAFVLSSDDIATAPRERFLERRGLGGILFALKVGGGAAEAGLSLTKVAGLMRQTNERTATLAVASRPPQHPVTGAPLFSLVPGQIEVGTGVHGEVGVYQGELLPANDLAALILDQLLADLKPFLKDRVWVFLNGSGGTSQMELHILYHSIDQVLAANGIQIDSGVVGSFFTTLEMGGFSLSLCVPDESMQHHWDAPAASPSFKWPHTV